MMSTFTKTQKLTSFGECLQSLLHAGAGLQELNAKEVESGLKYIQLFILASCTVHLFKIYSLMCNIYQFIVIDRTPLMLICASGHFDLVKQFLDIVNEWYLNDCVSDEQQTIHTGPINISLRCKDGHSALDYAHMSFKGSTACKKFEQVKINFSHYFTFPFHFVH